MIQCRMLVILGRFHRWVMHRLWQPLAQAVVVVANMNCLNIKKKENALAGYASAWQRLKIQNEQDDTDLWRAHV